MPHSGTGRQLVQYIVEPAVPDRLPLCGEKLFHLVGGKDFDFFFITGLEQFHVFTGIYLDDFLFYRIVQHNLNILKARLPVLVL
jgi:hypothetical protein